MAGLQTSKPDQREMNTVVAAPSEKTVLGQTRPFYISFSSFLVLSLSFGKGAAFHEVCH